MKRIYTYRHPTSLEHYTADAAVIRCLDNRFWKTFKHFIKSLGLKHIDTQSPAGGVLDLASPAEENDRNYVLRQLGIAISKHRAKKVMIFSHHDCAAYGGFKRFHNNEDEEFGFHVNEHKRARRVIKKRFGQLKVESYFIDGEGVIQIT